MEPGSTQKREMTAPILITHCPGGGGHAWARLNPRWSTSSRARPHDVLWCPDCQEEKRAHVHEAISKSQVERSEAYAALPLPSTKKCANPNPHPEDHIPGAVLSSGKFYRVQSSKKLDGTRNYILASRCKKCVRRENRERRESYDQDELKKQSKIRQARYRKRQREARVALAKERDRELLVGPLATWLKDYMRTTKKSRSEITRLAHIDYTAIKGILDSERKYVRTSTVDKIGIGCGYPDLLASLYPIEGQEEAA